MNDRICAPSLKYDVATDHIVTAVGSERFHIGPVKCTRAKLIAQGSAFGVFIPAAAPAKLMICR
jgi:hypothetical protein